MIRLLIFTFFFSSCSHIKKELGIFKTPLEDSIKNYQYYSSNDYMDHLSALGDFYLKSLEKQKILKLDSYSVEYLEDVSQRILSNNELLLEKQIRPKFYIIDDLTPFHFSTPDGKLFISKGLVDKYLKFEGLLASVIVTEILRMNLGLYNKIISIPLGYINLGNIIYISRMPFHDKQELNKWAIHCLKRAGFDPYAYLAWIQVLNKNSLDFSLLLGDVKRISREEMLLKSFIIEKKMTKNNLRYLENSSNSFYEFKSRIKKV